MLLIPNDVVSKTKLCNKSNLRRVRVKNLQFSAPFICKFWWQFWIKAGAAKTRLQSGRRLAASSANLARDRTEVWLCWLWACSQSASVSNYLSNSLNPIKLTTSCCWPQLMKNKFLSMQILDKNTDWGFQINLLVKSCIFSRGSLLRCIKNASLK